VNIIFNKLFVHCYKFRFERKKIGYDTVDDEALEFIFNFIENALSVKELINFHIDTSEAVDRINKNYLVGNLENLIEEFEKLI